MKMGKERLYDIRTNTTMRVDYGTMNLVPEVEVIILSVHPEYKITTKAKEQFISKGNGLTETRIVTSLAGINEIIGQLQATAASLAQFDQLASGLNKVIEQSKVK